MLAAIVYSLNTKKHDAEEIGRFILVGGTLEMRFPGDPDHHPPGEGMASPRGILERMRAAPVYLGPDREEEVTATMDPERWLRGLAIRYNGSYF